MGITEKIEEIESQPFQKAQRPVADVLACRGDGSEYALIFTVQCSSALIVLQRRRSM